MMNLFQMKIEKVENNYGNEKKSIKRMNFQIFKIHIRKFGGLNRKKEARPLCLFHYAP
jgi:hypothetical protein